MRIPLVSASVCLYPPVCFMQVAALETGKLDNGNLSRLPFSNIDSVFWVPRYSRYQGYHDGINDINRNKRWEHSSFRTSAYDFPAWFKWTMDDAESVRSSLINAFGFHFPSTISPRFHAVSTPRGCWLYGKTRPAIAPPPLKM